MKFASFYFRIVYVKEEIRNFGLMAGAEIRNLAADIRRSTQIRKNAERLISVSAFICVYPRLNFLYVYPKEAGYNLLIYEN